MDELYETDKIYEYFINMLYENEEINLCVSNISRVIFKLLKKYSLYYHNIIREVSHRTNRPNRLFILRRTTKHKE